MSTSPPWFVLVAGINGAGKSTFTQNSAVMGELVGDLGELKVINPDLVTRELRATERNLTLDRANKAAADETERRLKEILAEGRESVAIETVLSTDKYKPILTKAREGGYRVLFVYVLLDRVETAIERVRHRVKSGGHDVPEKKIRERWPRSLANLDWFWKQATLAFLFFNAPGNPHLIAERRDDTDTFHPAALAALLTSANR